MAHARSSKVHRIVSSGVVFGALLLACSGSGDGSAFGDGANGDGGAGSGQLGGGNGGALGGAGSGGAGTVGACAADSSKGQQRPLDIFVMLDQSLSMNEPVSGGGSKWTAVTGALTAFVQNPLSGVAVGLQYFGQPRSASACPTGCKADADCGPSGGPCAAGFCIGCVGGGGFGADSCNAADYAKPDVEIAALPGVASAITTSIAAHKPSTSTPTSAALEGAVDHAKAWAASNSGHVVVALLATDGDPTECDVNLANIDAIAAAGAKGTPRVLTFVIGVGTSLNALNGIAQAGGTQSAFIVDTTKNVNQQFLDALNKIRGAAVGCHYRIPLPTNGTPDYTRVNVRYTPGGGTPVLLPKVADATQCPASGDAWYYDDNTKPTDIVLCAGVCARVTADANGQIDVLTGCQSVVK